LYGIVCVIMDIQRSLGPVAIDLSRNGYSDYVQETYQSELARQGVAFPSPELSEVLKLWDANAALARGSIALEADGSVIDVSGFDFNAAAEQLRLPANRSALRNKEKLQSLTWLALLSEAGTDIASRKAAESGEESLDVKEARATTSSLKEFVQIAMVTERWGEPWNNVVADRFEGPTVAFPLSRRGMERGMTLLAAPMFEGIARQHFRSMSLLRFNIQATIVGQMPSSEYAEVYSNIAAGIGQFYHHSPKACDEMVQWCVSEHLLPGEVDWSEKIRSASEYTHDRMGEM